MSLEFDIENFSNLSSILAEIERAGDARHVTIPKSKNIKEERKPRSSTMNKEQRRAFIGTDLEAATGYKEERKPRSSTMLEPQKPKRSNFGRRASDPTGDTLTVVVPRIRIRSAPPCPVFDRAKVQSDSRLTEAAKQLSDEELALLYEDILKPLDFYAMLLERKRLGL